MTRATTFRATAIVGGFLLAILMIMTVSRAAFTDTTSNANNVWETGTVSLTDDYTRDSLGAMFPAGTIKPGDDETACIEVIYEGTDSASVGLSDISKTGSNGLAPALYLTIDRYPGGTGGDCGSGTKTPVFEGTLFEADGVPTFGDSWPASTGDTAFYEVKWEFVSGPDDNTYQGKDAMAAFTWQATG